MESSITIIIIITIIAINIIITTTTIIIIIIIITTIAEFLSRESACELLPTMLGTLVVGLLLHHYACQCALPLCKSRPPPAHTRTQLYKRAAKELKLDPKRPKWDVHSRRKQNGDEKQTAVKHMHARCNSLRITYLILWIVSICLCCKLTWLVLGEDPAARSHRVEQFTAL